MINGRERRRSRLWRKWLIYKRIVKWYRKRKLKIMEYVNKSDEIWKRGEIKMEKIWNK